MAIANLALRFVLELLGVAALGYWGFATAAATPWSLAAGVAASALLIVVWALVVAPKARNPISPRARELIGTGLLLAVAAALALAGQPVAAAALATAVVVNQVLLIVIDPARSIAVRRDAGHRA